VANLKAGNILRAENGRLRQYIMWKGSGKIQTVKVAKCREWFKRKETEHTDKTKAMEKIIHLWRMKTRLLEKKLKMKSVNLCC
jgi:hypothetical protein